jgi:hypothetical protein
MKAPRLPLFLSSCALWLALPSSAGAGLFRRGDDCAPCTRQTRAETAAELCNAGRFESLDCAGLASYAESYRMRINRQIAAAHYRPVAESTPVSGALPQLRPLPVSVPASASESAPPDKP